ncbi:probable cytochrome P450 309a2 [Zeugodacus cucurbitae]|uniref:Probable cytochrome P450 309a2 n=1 Tax=Zeugodacus cucurbitae TaxID=28588 RepID=A0A0A1WNF3_ZEUCU|nr:probable cytochrome P450 309a2 [Zeugodacus cucurbitae]
MIDCLFFQIIIILHLILLPIYLYLTWNFNYWRKRGLHNALPLTILGSFPSIITRNRNLLYEIDRLYRRYKHRRRMVGIFFVRQPQILVVDMRLAHEILDANFGAFEVTSACSWMRHRRQNKLDKLAACSALWSTGERWKSNRNVACAALTQARLKHSHELWQASCRRLMQFVQRKCGGDMPEVFDTIELVKRFVADALCITIWGVDAGTLTRSKKPNLFLQMTERAVRQTRSLRCYSLLSAVMPSFWKLWPFRLVSKAVENYFVQFTNDALECHRELRNPSGMRDVLSYLYTQQHTDRLSDESLTGHCMAMLLDGFEEICSTMIYSIYYLARDIRVQSKLRAEVLQTRRREHCTELGFETLKSLSYLNHCVFETLRLSPTVKYCRRICSSANVIKLSKRKSVLVDEGTVLCIPVYSYHHDPVIFCEPNSFIPERFDNTAPKELMERRVFLPFGTGPRSCLGKDMSMLIVKAAIASLVSEFSIMTCSQTQHGCGGAVDSFLLNLNGKLMLEFNKL